MLIVPGEGDPVPEASDLEGGIIEGVFNVPPFLEPAGQTDVDSCRGYHAVAQPYLDLVDISPGQVVPEGMCVPQM